MSLPPETKILCLVGKNGSGKSSIQSWLIDSLCQLSSESAPDLKKGLHLDQSDSAEGRWVRTQSTAEITKGKSSYGIRADWILGETPSMFHVAVKTLVQNGEPPELLPELFEDTQIRFDPDDWSSTGWSFTPSAANDPVAKGVLLVRPSDRFESPTYEEPKGLTVAPVIRSRWARERAFPIRVRNYGVGLEQFLLDMLLGAGTGESGSQWLQARWSAAFLQLTGDTWQPTVSPWPFRRIGPSGVGAMSSLSAGELDILSTIALILGQQIALVRTFPQVSWDQTFGPGGFVFVDELDAHLHPEWQERVMPLLTSLFPNILFVITTHSPFVLRSLKAKESVVVRLPDGLTFETDFSAWQIEDILKLAFEVSADWSEPLKEQLKEFERLIRDPDKIPEALARYEEILALNSDPLHAECRKLIALYATPEFQAKLPPVTAKPAIA